MGTLVPQTWIIVHVEDIKEILSLAICRINIWHCLGHCDKNWVGISNPGPKHLAASCVSNQQKKLQCTSYGSGKKIPQSFADWVNSSLPGCKSREVLNSWPLSTLYNGPLSSLIRLGSGPEECGFSSPPSQGFCRQSSALIFSLICFLRVSIKCFCLFFQLVLYSSRSSSLPPSLALSCPVIICNWQFIFTSLSIPPLLPCLFLSAHLWPLHPFFYPSLTFLASLPLTAKSDPCEKRTFFPLTTIPFSLFLSLFTFLPFCLGTWGNVTFPNRVECRREGEILGGSNSRDALPYRFPSLHPPTNLFHLEHFCSLSFLSSEAGQGLCMEWDNQRRQH